MKWLGRAAVGLLILLGSARSGAEPQGVRIWYRGTEGCPDGDVFVKRLAELGRDARLASVGDRVDFVVTVAHSGDGSSGRLERQTEHGQMAIRDLRAPHCEEVSEGLALSLDLALDPVEVPASAPSAGADASASEVLLGLDATLTTGLAPAPLPGLALFAQLGWPRGPSVRLAARGAHGNGEASSGVEVEVSTWGGRVEGCPLSWQGGSLSLSPCVGLDLGGMQAASSNSVGRSDTGIWASATAGVHAGWDPFRSLRVGLNVGAIFPFVRYELGSGIGPPVFRTEPVGLDVGLGAAWRMP